MSLTVITPTFNRPHWWHLTEMYVKRQTRQPDEWIVVSNGNLQGYTFTMGQQVVKRKPLTPHGKSCEVRWDVEGVSGKILHALNLNFLEIIDLIKTEFVVVVEDDDWLSPLHFETLLRYIGPAEIVGVAPAKYWITKYREHRVLDNDHHASLGATAFKSKLLPQFRIALETGDPFIDWRIWTTDGIPKCVVPNENFHIGLKDGNGIGRGHLDGGTPDPDGKILKRWIGEDAEYYL